MTDYDKMFEQVLGKDWQEHAGMWSPEPKKTVPLGRLVRRLRREKEEAHDKAAAAAMRTLDNRFEFNRGREQGLKEALAIVAELLDT